VHGRIAFAGNSAEALNNNDLIREFKFGSIDRMVKSDAAGGLNAAQETRRAMGQAVEVAPGRDRE